MQRYIGALALFILLSAGLLACTREGEDSAMDELEAKAHSLEERLAAVEEGQTRTAERLDIMEASVEEIGGGRLQNGLGPLGQGPVGQG